jgi:hypothetical protein
LLFFAKNLLRPTHLPTAKETTTMFHDRLIRPAARVHAGLHFPAPAVIGGPRRRALDRLMTFDASVFAQDALANGVGRKLPNGPVQTHDGLANCPELIAKFGDRFRVVDSTGAFMVGELERLDLTLHEPLASVSWGRDIELREDVTIADEVSAFTVSSYGSAGGLGDGQGIGTGKSWIGKNTNQITGVSVDIGKITQPLLLWGEEIKYTIPELESAARLGRPIDQQKYNAMQLKHQMDIDEQVYIGDTGLSVFGLYNSDSRTGVDKVTAVANIANGVSGSALWTRKSPDEILQDVNEALTTAWGSTGWAVVPSAILLPPGPFGYIATTKVSNAGNVSILKYLHENNLLTTSKAGNLSIYPSKWGQGTGVGGTIGTTGAGHDRMVVYTNEKDRVRFPLTLLQRTPIQYSGIYQLTTYFCRLGVVEIVYPETVLYRDGLS